MKPRFAEYYMDIAKRSAQMSYARRLKVGAVAVDISGKRSRILSTSWNGMPEGMDNNCEIENEDGTLTTRPEVLHAEENTITKAAEAGESTRGAVLFITHSPCMNCAKLIHGSGFVEVIYDKMYRSNDGLKYLIDRGVIVTKYSNIVMDSSDYETVSENPCCEIHHPALELDNLIRKTLTANDTLNVDFNPYDDFSALIPPPSPIETSERFVANPPKIMRTPIDLNKIGNSEPLLGNEWNFIKKQYPNGELDLFFLLTTNGTASQFEEFYDAMMSGVEIDNYDPSWLERIGMGIYENLDDYYGLRNSKDVREMATFLRFVTDIVYNRYSEDFKLTYDGEELNGASVSYNFDKNNKYLLNYTVRFDGEHGAISDVWVAIYDTTTTDNVRIYIDKLDKSLTEGWIPDVVINSLTYFINKRIIEVETHEEIKE